MKTVHYFGFYAVNKSKYRENIAFNPAGTMKMRYIIDSLKKMGYKVKVISIMLENRTGYFSKEIIKIDDQEEILLVPYFNIHFCHRDLFQFFSINNYLKKYIRSSITSNDIVINYHALHYNTLFNNLHSEIGFRWICQIEEIYSLNRKRKIDCNALKTEAASFKNANSFLFVNEYLAQKYANNKKYAVSYGNCNVHYSIAERDNDFINVTYTGIINRERGAFLILKAFETLPDRYKLNILGFGAAKTMQQFLYEIEVINKKAGYKKISFCGTKTGKDYDHFLETNQIGISIIDDSESYISNNSFPSKIMAYLGHGLRVVSTDCESIRKSKVDGILYYCQNNPNSIRDCILSIDLNSKYNSQERLLDLQNEFYEDLNLVIDGADEV